MQILLLVLKIIGLVIAGLLGLVIFLLLLILFWPIRYRAEVSYHKEPLVSVKAGWMGVIAFRLNFEKKKLIYRLKVLGFTIKEKGGEKKGGFLKKKERSVGRNKEHEAGNAERSFEDKDRGLKLEGDLPGKEGLKIGGRQTVEKSFEIEGKPDAEKEKPFEAEKGQNSKKETGEKKSSPIQAVLEKIRGILGKIKSLFLSIPVKIRAAIEKAKKMITQVREKITALWNKILNICHKIKKIYEFITLTENRRCAGAVLKMGTRLLKHISPRKIKGFVRFGLKDPCSTGELLGVLSVFYGFYGKNISIYPEFEEPCLEGEILIKGYMQVGVILFHAVKIYISKELKTLKYNYQKLKEEL